jgi:membrane-associated phospholipid phosphatase
MPISLRSPARPSDTMWSVRDRRLALAAGTAYVALGAMVRNGSSGDSRVFGALNHHSSSQPALRAPQQLGTPWTLPLLGLVGFWTRRPHLALWGAAALPLEKAGEVGLKKVLGRLRPARVDPRTQLHDDAPTDGPSYPSGHAAIATLAVLLPAPYLPRPAVGLAAAAAAGTGVARIQQGAHFPLDAVGGVFLAGTVAGVLRTVFGRPVRPRA